MKRPRPPTPDIFNDSSPSSSPPPQRPRPSIEPVEDTLEAFMTNLSSQPSHQATVLQEDSDSSNEFDTAPKEELFEKTNGEQWQNVQRNGHERDLVLQPVDFESKTLRDVLRPCRFPRRFQSHAEHRITLKTLNASYEPEQPQIYPLLSFSSLPEPHPPNLLTTLTSTFSKPTPIQSLAIPAALEGRNIIGIATTGSGKTLAYIIPLLIHVYLQPGSSRHGKGPNALILSPTRELAIQICSEVRRFHGRVCEVIGGRGKHEQYLILRDSGMDVVVATPGRLIDMLKMKACTLARCSMVVLDEADRMLDMGFEPQIRSIMGWIRPDAQRMLFSATLGDVGNVAKRVVGECVKVIVSNTRSVEMVSEAVTERYVWMESAECGKEWMKENVPRMLPVGAVIVFCGTRGEAADMANYLRGCGIVTACVHGEMASEDREGWVEMFRGGEVGVLVSTDLSARGLDMEDVGTVINWGCAKSWEWHVHRVGRTGRAGRKGRAVTLVRANDMKFVREAVRRYCEDGRVVEGLKEIFGRLRGRRRR